MLENDVYFPLSPGFPHHVRISAYAIVGSRNHSILHRVGVKNAKDADVFKNDFEKEFKNELKNCGASNVVLTSEFCFSLLQNEIDNLNDLLKSVAKKIKIIVYLRRQDNYWVSDYVQSIKSGYSIEKFGLPGKKQIDQMLDYYSIVRRWENAFGIENIIVRPFEKIQMFESDLTKDFLKVLGLDCSSQYSLEKHLNKRIDANTMEVVRRINQYISVADSEWKLKAAYTLKAAAQEISEGLPYEMLYENRVALMKYFEVGNKKLAQRYLDRVDGDLFSESPECSPSVLDQELSIDSSLQVTAKLWLWANKKMVQLEKRNNVLEETLANKKVRTLVALAVKQAVRLSSILTRKIHS